MRNILIGLTSATILATLNVPSSAQTYLYGMPSNGVSSGPYGNADYQRYRHNDWRDSTNDWRSQRNDFRNNNESVWRRERNDWQKTDDWRTRVRPGEDEARAVTRDGDRNNINDRNNVNGRNNINNAGVYDNPTGSPDNPIGSPQENLRQTPRTSPVDDDCRGPWRRDTANKRCR